MSQKITPAEQKEIQDLYGKPLEKLTSKQFEQKQKALRSKYHPDKFEQYEDEVVKELAKQRFQRIEALGDKVRAYLQVGAQKPLSTEEDIFDERARFAFEDMKIEVRTRNADLKYHLFGSRYRWLEKGDRYKLPGTVSAYIIIDQDHQGRGIGFLETVRMYVTFGEEDDMDLIVDWLYQRLSGQAEALLVAGKRIKVDRIEIMGVMKRTSFLRLAAPDEE
jgi:hypothetical protein